MKVNTNWKQKKKKKQCEGNKNNAKGNNMKEKNNHEKVSYSNVKVKIIVKGKKPWHERKKKWCKTINNAKVKTIERKQEISIRK